MMTSNLNLRSTPQRRASVARGSSVEPAPPQNPQHNLLQQQDFTPRRSSRLAVRTQIIPSTTSNNIAKAFNDFVEKKSPLVAYRDETSNEGDLGRRYSSPAPRKSSLVQSKPRPKTDVFSPQPRKVSFDASIADSGDEDEEEFNDENIAPSVNKLQNMPRSSPFKALQTMFSLGQPSPTTGLRHKEVEEDDEEEDQDFEDEEQSAEEEEEEEMEAAIYGVGQQRVGTTFGQLSDSELQQLPMEVIDDEEEVTEPSSFLVRLVDSIKSTRIFQLLRPFIAALGATMATLAWIAFGSITVIGNGLIVWPLRMVFSLAFNLLSSMFSVVGQIFRRRLLVYVGLVGLIAYIGFSRPHHLSGAATSAIHQWNWEWLRVPDLSAIRTPTPLVADMIERISSMLPNSSQPSNEEPVPLPQRSDEEPVPISAPEEVVTLDSSYRAEIADRLSQIEASVAHLLSGNPQLQNNIKELYDMLNAAHTEVKVVSEAVAQGQVDTAALKARVDTLVIQDVDSNSIQPAPQLIKVLEEHFPAKLNMADAIKVVRADIKAEITETRKVHDDAHHVMETELQSLKQSVEEGNQKLRIELTDEVVPKQIETALSQQRLQIEVIKEEVKQSVVAELEAWLPPPTPESRDEESEAPAPPPTPEVDLDKINNIVESTVYKYYSADVLAKPDYALESAGARVLPAFTSPTYAAPSQGNSVVLSMRKIFGLSLGNRVKPPQTVLRPNMHTGECWAMEGASGHLGIRLATSIIPTAFTIEHIPQEVALDVDHGLPSAPRDIEIWAIFSVPLFKDLNLDEDIVREFPLQKSTQSNQASSTSPATDSSRGTAAKKPMRSLAVPPGVLLATHRYDPFPDSMRSIQTFPVREEVLKRLEGLGLRVRDVLVRVKNNHGNPGWTCLYRVRAHGYEL
ncbi:hypothetical protein HK102_000424 [Quaeritorhiza haematococci]|nr:hypothetical protein HK102_000424 [Quaeritorhiza haematococci]